MYAGTSMWSTSVKTPCRHIEAAPRTPWPIKRMSVLPRDLRPFPVLLVRICFLYPMGTGMGPIPSLTFPSDSIDLEF